MLSSWDFISIECRNQIHVKPEENIWVAFVSFLSLMIRWHSSLSWFLSLLLGVGMSVCNSISWCLSCEKYLGFQGQDTLLWYMFWNSSVLRVESITPFISSSFKRQGTLVMSKDILTGDQEEGRPEHTLTRVFDEGLLIISLDLWLQSDCHGRWVFWQKEITVTLYWDGQLRQENTRKRLSFSFIALSLVI